MERILIDIWPDGKLSSGSPIYFFVTNRFFDNIKIIGSIAYRSHRKNIISINTKTKLIRAISRSFWP